MERKATYSDVDAVYEMYMDPVNNPFLSYEPMEREDFLPIFTELLNSGDLYVYEREGRAAATYVVRRRTHRMSHVAYLGGLAVHPAFRSNGVGTKVMETLVERLRGEGVKRVELLVVTDNKKAIEFYERLGFEREGVLKCFLKRHGSDQYLDELMMAKILITDCP